jgi:large subunit ribosomal protein L23
MKLTPVFTEKSMADAKNGKYSFWVAPSMTKTDIKSAINKAFQVHVKGVKTVNKKQVTRRTLYGKFQTTKARKKAIVTLAAKETIDLFEDKSEKKGKKSK